MQRTICGVTPKVRIHNRKSVDSFLEKEEKSYTDFLEADYCLYEGNKLVPDASLNYLNKLADNKVELQLKKMLYKEFSSCESFYPYLGDMFIHQFFNDKEEEENQELTLLNRNSIEEFSKTIKSKPVKEIFEWLLENSSIEYTIDVREGHSKDICVEKNNSLSFDVKYDVSFLGSKTFHTMKDYKFIIIDGHIETVGEIHHLLDQAYNTKIPHVIFCFGMSNDVDHVIKYNNTHSKFEIFPVVLEFNEETINILHDLAIAHNDQVVSSKTGQTISQAVRADLKVGNEIIFTRSGFKIKPVASIQQLMLHRSFLRNRIIESSNEENAKYLKARLKSFSNKNIKIFIPRKLMAGSNFGRELDYCLRLLKYSNSPFLIKRINKRERAVPFKFFKLIDDKIKSLQNIFKNIDKVVIHAGH